MKNGASLSYRTLARAAVAALSLLALSACLPTNNFGNAINTGAGGASSLGDGLATNATDDGALPPCTQYDPSTPTRATCVSCYQNLLATRCPGKTAFASCIDPAVVTGYVSLVNTCISQSIQAGFTCSVICPTGQVINPASCTCSAPVGLPVGTGTGNTDVGQTDFGPPIIGANLPTTSLGGTPTPLTAPTACAGQLPLYLGVQNRGDTIFRLDNFGPTVMKPSNTYDQEPLPQKYFLSASQPILLTTGQIAQHPGTNAFSLLSFVTGGAAEITGGIVGRPNAVAGPSGGRVGNISTVSGANSDGIDFSGGGGTLARDATWTSPGMGARDIDGNVYFSDPFSNVVEVICYNPGNSPYCTGQPVGTTVIIAGTPGSAGFTGNAGPGNQATLNSPHGVAVTSTYDVFIADSGNNAVRFVCGNHTLGYCAGTGVGDGKINNVFTGGNFPYGLDVELSGNSINVYVAELQGQTISKFCQWKSKSACQAAGPLTPIIGNGSPGYRIDANITVGAGFNADLRYPTDVKVNSQGDLVYADSRNHLVRGICFSNPATATDFCKGAPHQIVTIAGQAPAAGITILPVGFDQGEGVSGDLAAIAFPRQILLGKRYADDPCDGTTGGTFPTFCDNNVLFTEALWGSANKLGFAAPTAIQPLSGTFTSMFMGNAHSCMLSSTGNVWCVGNNQVNQIGAPASTPNQSVPVKVALPSTMANGALGGGSNQTCIGLASKLYCWGDDSNSQLGDNGAGTPATIEGTTKVQSSTSTGPNNPIWKNIVGGDLHTCAWDSNGGQLWCFGDNSSGQLGTVDNNAPHSQVDAAVLRAGATPAAAPAGTVTWTGVFASGANHVCGVSNAPKVYCWGDNSEGQLGTTDNTNWGGAEDITGNVTSAEGVLVPSITGLYAGGNHTCAVDSTIQGGTLVCWGSNGNGELGNGTVNAAGVSTPTLISGITPLQVPAGIASVALGTHHTCAATIDGDPVTAPTIFCWGDNSAGQLGNDEITQSPSPFQVIGLPLGHITGLYAGGNQTCALIGGTPYCWGENDFTALGTGPNSNSAAGNTVRIVCGDNTGLSGGFCQGTPPPAYTLTAGVVHQGPIFTIAGSSGKAGNKGTGDGGNARNALFAKASGLSFDLYKNLIVSDGGFQDAQGNNHTDFSLRLINNAVVGPVNGVKYNVTDNNGQSSYWCLRLKPLTACDSAGTCACAMVPPTDEVDPNFWEATELKPPGGKGPCE